MDRRELVRRATSRLPATADRAVYPDHPLLLEPPEILASDGGRLYAVFVIAASDRFGIGRHNLSRYLLARLALPEQTVFVAVVEDRLDVDALPKDAFDQITPATSRERAPLPAEPSDSAWRAVANAARTAHFERFSEAWNAKPATRSELVHRGGVVTTVQVSTDAGLLPQRRGQHIVFDGRRVLLAAPRGSRAQTISLARRGSRLAVQADYGLSEPRTDPDYARPGDPGLDPGTSTWLADHRLPSDEWVRRGPIVKPRGGAGPRAPRSLEKRREEHRRLPELARDVVGLLTAGRASLAFHQGFLPLAETVRSFDQAKPQRAAAFAGFLPLGLEPGQ